MIYDSRLDQAQKFVEEYTKWYNTLSDEDLDEIVQQAYKECGDKGLGAFCEYAVAHAVSILFPKPLKRLNSLAYEFTRRRLAMPHKLIHRNKIITNEIYEAARISKAVYHPKEIGNVGQWQLQYNNWVKYEDADTGLKSALYKRVVNNESEYIYAFAGTDFTSWKDIKADIEQIYGQTRQYDLALENANNISHKLRNSKLTFVGHSKGGGEAAYCALKTESPKRQAITFNPAGLSSVNEEDKPFKDNIQTYILMTDPLNIIQDMNLAGIPQADGIKHYIHFHPLDNPHRIISVMEGIIKYLPK